MKKLILYSLFLLTDTISHCSMLRHFNINPQKYIRALSDAKSIKNYRLQVTKNRLQSHAQQLEDRFFDTDISLINSTEEQRILITKILKDTKKVISQFDNLPNNLQKSELKLLDYHFNNIISEIKYLQQGLTRSPGLHNSLIKNNQNQLNTTIKFTQGLLSHTESLLQILTTQELKK